MAYARIRPPLYGSWMSMRRYCGIVKGATPYQLALYEGVGVCPAWHDYSMFERWALAHGWSKGMHLTRLDKGGDFCPENCVWCSLERANGKRSCVRRLPDGRSARDIIGDKRLGEDHESQMRVAYRLFSMGWPVEKALTSRKFRRPHTEASTVDGPYNVWRHLRRLCVSKGGLRQRERAAYDGIILCQMWRDSYEAFSRWCIDNGWRRGMYVARIDKRGNFCPDNCVVSTRIHAKRKERES